MLSSKERWESWKRYANTLRAKGFEEFQIEMIQPLTVCDPSIPVEPINMPNIEISDFAHHFRFSSFLLDRELKAYEKRINRE